MIRNGFWNAFVYVCTKLHLFLAFYLFRISLCVLPKIWKRSHALFQNLAWKRMLYLFMHLGLANRWILWSGRVCVGKKERRFYARPCISFREVSVGEVSMLVYCRVFSHLSWIFQAGFLALLCFLCLWP